MTDEQYMKIALKLAEKGAGYVAPNPMVGAIIVLDGQIIGSGYHQKYGGLHAEREALLSCRDSPSGAVMYVTLEPCCHYGKTPPCTQALIDAGISHVVVGSCDPNPLVAGKGIQKLRAHGIKVSTGILQAECERLNQAYLHYMTNGVPYTAMKYAISADGKIATRTGDAKWITGEKARRHAHGLRSRYTAIMVGVGTVRMDNPMLNCRVKNGRHPVRIICDTHLKTPLTSQIVTTAGDIRTIIVTGCSNEQAAAHIQAGCELLKAPLKEGRINLAALMPRLAEAGIDSLLIEGGGALHGSAVDAGIINKVYVYIAPKIIGGSYATSPVGGNGASFMAQAVQLVNREVTELGEDMLLEYDIIKHQSK